MFITTFSKVKITTSTNLQKISNKLIHYQANSDREKTFCGLDFKPITKFVTLTRVPEPISCPFCMDLMCITLNNSNSTIH